LRMKVLESLQKLWEYCQFCPICQESCRKIRVDVQPDDTYELVSFEKNDNQLKLNCLFSFHREQTKVSFEIDAYTNGLQTKISEPVVTIQSGGVFRSKRTFVVFQIFGDCEKCRCTHATSAEMELSMLDNSIGTTKVDREGIYLLESVDKFHLTLIYDRRVLLVSRCYLDQDNTVIDDNRILELPLVNLDLSNTEKTLAKVKTLILFS